MEKDLCWLQYINPEFLPERLLTSFIVGDPEKYCREYCKVMDATVVRIDEQPAVNVGDVIQIDENRYCRVVDTVTLKSHKTGRAKSICYMSELDVEMLIRGVANRCCRYVIEWQDGVPRWVEMPRGKRVPELLWTVRATHCFVIH